MNGNADPADATPDDEVPDVIELGMRLGAVCAPAIVATMLDYELLPQQRVEFFRAFFATLSGMSQQSIGHASTVKVLRFVADLKPINDTRAAH